MVSTYKMVKKKIYPRPHNMGIKFNMFPATATKRSTFVPILMQDEALGSPSGYSSHPENASFAEVNEANCYPESRVNSAYVELDFMLPEQTWSTDKVEHLVAYIIPVFTSFEDALAIDEKTSTEVQDVLELQRESTNRSQYPLWNATKLDGAVLDLGTNARGLTTNTNIEGITFDPELLYDALQYYTISGKLSKNMGNIRKMTITRSKHSSIKFRMKINEQVKRMNPYTFCGVIIHIPDDDTIYQPNVVDFTANTVVGITARIRYLEWNDDFDHMRV